MNAAKRRYPRWGLFKVASLCLVIAAGCDLPGVPEFQGEPEPEPEPETAPGTETEEFELRGNAEAGESFYQAQCVSCHGVQGRGDGAEAEGMDPPTVSFTEVSLEPERTYRIIRDGGAAVGMSRAMPAFREAADDQTLRDVAAYTLELGQQQPDE